MRSSGLTLLAASGYGPDKPIKVEFTTFNGVFPNDFDLGRAIVDVGNTDRRDR